MKQFNELLKKYESFVTLAGIVVTIIGFFVCTTAISNTITANFSNVNTNEVNINGFPEESVEQRFFEAQTYYRAGDYGNAMRIYQEIQNEHAVAKSNIGYLYAYGLGVDQSTQIASEYYRQAYEMDYEQALHNYISINLTSPSGYAETLSALKYGYHQNDKTAILYLAAAFCGQMPDLPAEQLRKMADEFMTLDKNAQLLKLKDILQFVNSEIVLFVDDNPPKDTDFAKSVKTNNTITSCEIMGYNPITDSVTNETYIFAISTVTEMNVYMKENYSFYMGSYCPLDKFGEG